MVQSSHHIQAVRWNVACMWFLQRNLKKVNWRLYILVETYGFLPSCGTESEALCIADPNEARVLEVFSVGNEIITIRADSYPFIVSTRVNKNRNTNTLLNLVDAL